MNALLEWLGAGGYPVRSSLATDRAFICEHCPQNGEPHWWEKAKEPIADAIKEMLEVRSGMGLTVPNEESLHMCKSCGCCVKLLVHTPIEHIEKHMTPELYKKHPDHCWKVIEIKEMSETH